MESAGRNKKATDVRKRILEWTQAECGKGSPESLEARFDLAYALEECKEPVEAAKHYSIVREGQLRLYGSTAPDTLDTRNNLAVALHSSNQLSEAIQEYEVLLADLESLPEPDPEFVDTVRSRLEQWRQEQQGGTD